MFPTQNIPKEFNREIRVEAIIYPEELISYCIGTDLWDRWSMYGVFLAIGAPSTISTRGGKASGAQSTVEAPK